ncbi:hypothetical protein GCM10027176_22920 [Actinoallomurus bryophytorum]
MNGVVVVVVAPLDTTRSVSRWRPEGTEGPVTLPEAGVGKGVLSDASADDAVVGLMGRKPRTRFGFWPPNGN